MSLNNKLWPTRLTSSDDAVLPARGPASTPVYRAEKNSVGVKKGGAIRLCAGPVAAQRAGDPEADDGELIEAHGANAAMLDRMPEPDFRSAVTQAHAAYEPSFETRVPQLIDW